MIREIYQKALSILTSKRFRAFYWHIGTMAAAMSLDFTLAELTAWNPDNFITVLAGIIFAQITKQLNKKELSEMEKPFEKNGE